MRLKQDRRLHFASGSSRRRAPPSVSPEIGGGEILDIRGGVHVGSAVSPSVESCWQHASGDQRAPLLLLHEWLMFSIFSGFFSVCLVWVKDFHRLLFPWVL